MPPQEMMNVTEYIYKRDIDLMMSVNQKAVELQTAVADQNEEIIEMLRKIFKQNEDSFRQKEGMVSKLDKIIKANDDLEKNLFRFQVVAISGVFAIILQVIGIFLKK